MGGAQAREGQDPNNPSSAYCMWVSLGPQGRKALCPLREAPSPALQGKGGRAPACWGPGPTVWP